LPPPLHVLYDRSCRLKWVLLAPRIKAKT